MSSTDTEIDQANADAVRDQIAVTKDQMRRLQRVLVVGGARVSTSLDNDPGNSNKVGEYAIKMSLSTKVPFITPYRELQRHETKQREQRMVASGVAISVKGVHLLARVAPLITDVEPDRDSRRFEWVPIEDVLTVEQVI